jgi:xanthine dehydrogenase YagR molybdenum-binding subunit
VPVHADVPDSNVIFIDAHDPRVHALGTKTIGMLGVAIATAIASVIFHATGKRVRALSTTLNQLL